MTKCNGNIKLNVNVIKKSSADKSSKAIYSVMKSVYACNGDRVALELPQCIKSGLTFKEAHALKRRVIDDYFG